MEWRHGNTFDGAHWLPVLLELRREEDGSVTLQNLYHRQTLTKVLHARTAHSEGVVFTVGKPVRHGPLEADKLRVWTKLSVFDVWAWDWQKRKQLTKF